MVLSLSRSTGPTACIIKGVLILKIDSICLITDLPVSYCNAKAIIKHTLNAPAKNGAKIKISDNIANLLTDFYKLFLLLPPKHLQLKYILFSNSWS